MGQVGLQVVRIMGSRGARKPLGWLPVRLPLVAQGFRKGDLFVGIFKPYLFMVLLALACPALGANISEYALKAAYLSNFAQSVKWPKATFADDNSPIVVGVLGSDPFGSTLEDATRGKTVSGRTLVVKRFNNFDKEKLDELRNCQILFIANSEQDNVREILEGLKGSPLLTVSEINQFPKLGGIIQFIQEGDSIGLAMNPKTAMGVKLRLSSQLMKVAKLEMDVDASKVKTMYFEGVQLYMNGELKEAIKKWKECLQEDPGYAAAQDQISKAKFKLKAISNIK